MSELKKDAVKGKYVLEFDEPPALVFVSHDGKKEEIYMNGERVRYWTAIKIDSAIDKFTEYDLSLVALKPKEEWKEEQKKGTPYLDELSKDLRAFSSRYGYIPDSIKMNPIYFAELVIENKDLSMIQQIDISNIRFQGIPVKMDANIDSYQFI